MSYYFSFRSIDRYLSDLGYPASLTKDDAFALSRKVLASKRKELKSLGKGNGDNKTDALSPTEEDLLWEKGSLGTQSPVQLQRAVWYLISKLMGKNASAYSTKIGFHNDELRFIFNLQCYN